MPIDAIQDELIARIYNLRNIAVTEQLVGDSSEQRRLSLESEIYDAFTKTRNKLCQCADEVTINNHDFVKIIDTMITTSSEGATKLNQLRPKDKEAKEEKLPIDYENLEKLSNHINEIDLALKNYKAAQRLAEKVQKVKLARIDLILESLNENMESIKEIFTNQRMRLTVFDALKEVKDNIQVKINRNDLSLEDEVKQLNEATSRVLQSLSTLAKSDHITDIKNKLSKLEEALTKAYHLEGKDLDLEDLRDNIKIEYPDLSQTKTALLPAAFAPAVKREDYKDKEKIHDFYGEKPDYAVNGSGTIPEHTTLPEEEQLKIATFNKQFAKLIDYIRSLKEEYQLTTYQLEKLSAFQTSVQNRNYYASQTTLYYGEIKSHLEIIVLRLSDKTILEQLKKEELHQLLNKIDFCGPSVPARLQQTANILSDTNTLESTLANTRRNIIDQLASLHIELRGVDEGGEQHVENAFAIHANQLHWNQAGFELYAAVNEIHYGLAKIQKGDLEKFETDFLRRYNAEEIVDIISNELHAKVSDRFKNPPIIIKSQAEYDALFRGIFFAKDSLEPFCYVEDYDEKANNKSIPPVDCIYSGYSFRLKSLPELRLSVTQYLNEKITPKLYQTKAFEFDEKVAHDFITINSALANMPKESKDQPQLLRAVTTADSPNASYFEIQVGTIEVNAEIGEKANKEKKIITPIFKTVRMNDIVIPSSAPVEFAIQVRGIITDVVFKKMLAAGVMDFSHCIFDTIDLTQLDLKQFQELQFNIATFKNAKVNFTQFCLLQSTTGVTISPIPLPIGSTQENFTETGKAIINNTVFHHMLKAGVTNFSHCILEAVQFTGVDIQKQKLQFSHATLNNIGSSFIQFRILQSLAPASLSCAHHSLEGMFDMLWDEATNDRAKLDLYFYLMETGNPKAIDTFSEALTNNYIILATALRRGTQLQHWKGVEDLIDKAEFHKLSNQSVFVYKRMLPTLAATIDAIIENNQTTLFTKLLNKLDPNELIKLRPLITDTALSCINKNNIAMLALVITEIKTVRYIPYNGQTWDPNTDYILSLLTSACKKGSWQCAALIVKEFPDFTIDKEYFQRSDNQKEFNDLNQSFLLAAKANQLDIVKVLLKINPTLQQSEPEYRLNEQQKKSSVRSNDNHGYSVYYPYQTTALHHAAANNNIDMIELLKAAGIKEEIKNLNGESAFFVAAKLNSWEAMTALYTSLNTVEYDDRNDWICKAVNADQASFIDKLVSHEYESSAVFEYHKNTKEFKSSPTHQAAILDKPDMLKHLLNLKIPYTALDEHNKLPIQYSIEKDLWDNIKTFRDHKPKPEKWYQEILTLTDDLNTLMELFKTLTMAKSTNALQLTALNDAILNLKDFLSAPGLSHAMKLKLDKYHVEKDVYGDSIESKEDTTKLVAERQNLEASLAKVAVGLEYFIEATPKPLFGKPPTERVAAIDLAEKMAKQMPEHKFFSEKKGIDDPLLKFKTKVQAIIISQEKTETGKFLYNLLSTPLQSIAKNPDKAQGLVLLKQITSSLETHYNPAKNAPDKPKMEAIKKIIDLAHKCQAKMKPDAQADDSRPRR